VIAVYDMTSGTLRKELEAETQTTIVAPTDVSAAYQAPAYAELQLQEVTFSQHESTDKLPESILSMNVQDILDHNQ